MKLQTLFQAQNIIGSQGEIKFPATFGKARDPRVAGKTELLILINLMEVIR